MRALTIEEIANIRGGDKKTGTLTSVTVTAPGAPGFVGGGGGGGGGGGSGGGTGSVKAAKAGVVNITPGGHKYTVGVSLTVSQTQALDAILDYGIDHSYTPEEIDVAVVQAYYESSLNPTAVNGNFQGLFQYNQATWTALGETGSINSETDQITAIYNDISAFEPRFAAAEASNAAGINSYELDYMEYFEIKHHGGSNSVNWGAVDPATGKTYVSDINTAEYTVNLSYLENGPG